MEKKTAEQLYADAIIERTQACFDQNNKIDIEPFILDAMKAYAEQAVKADREKIGADVDSWAYATPDGSVVCLREKLMALPIDLPQ